MPLAFLDRHEQRLRARAHGRVLDLGESGRPSLAALVESGERFDTVVSIFQLSRSRDAEADAAAVARLLADEGELVFLEPTATPGLAGSVQRLIGRANQDIPAVLRRSGLSLSECDRITVAAMWPARMYVEGVAFRSLIAARTPS